MIRLNDLTLFKRVEADSAVSFPNVRERTVRMSVNCPQRTQLQVVPLTDDGELVEEDTIFLCSVDGLEDVEFFALGPFALIADAGFYLKTSDGRTDQAVVPDAQTFTRIAERRIRNPDLEHMQAVLLANEQRRMAPLYAQLAEMEDRLAAVNTRETSSLNPQPPAGPSGGSSGNEGSPDGAGGSAGGS